MGDMRSGAGSDEGSDLHLTGPRGYLARRRAFLAADPAPIVWGGSDAFGGMRPAYASWGRRVVAAFLDGGIVTGAAFVLSSSVPNLGPLLGAAFVSNQAGLAPIEPWGTGGWIVGVVVLIGLMEALIGSSPGKLVVGIAIVRELDARPIGILWTVLRRLAHVVDALLLVGYARPLWDSKRRTFADSIAGTLVLATRRPRAHRWFARSSDDADDPGPPLVWESPSAPRWRPAATTAAAVVCVLGLGFSAGFTSDERTVSSDSSCSMLTPDGGGSGLTGGSLTRWVVHQDVTRLFVSRNQVATGGWSAEWTWSRTPPESADLVLRIAFVLEDGSSSSFDSAVPDRAAHSATIDLTSSDAELLSRPLTWSQTMVVNGDESTACSGSLGT